MACRVQKPAGFSGTCFIANAGSHTIAVVDLATFHLRREIPLDAAPSQILALPVATPPAAPLPFHDKAFVLAPDAGTVYEIDAATSAVGRRLRAGNQAIRMALAPGNDALWVLYRDPAELIEVPLDSFKPRRRIRLSGPADGFDLSQLKQAAIASYRDHTITLASLETGAVQQVIAAKDEPSLIQFQRDGKQLLSASHPGRSLTIYHTASSKTVVRLPLSIAPRNFCPKADGGQVYVTGDGMDAVVIVYPYVTEIAETILAGHAPGEMAVVNNILLVANSQNSRVTALDVDTMGKKLVAVVDVGQEPGKLFSTPDGKWAFALNQKSGDMAVILVSALTAPRLYHKPAPMFALVSVGERPVDAAIVAST